MGGGLKLNLVLYYVYTEPSRTIENLSCINIPELNGRILPEIIFCVQMSTKYFGVRKLESYLSNSPQELFQQWAGYATVLSSESLVCSELVRVGTCHSYHLGWLSWRTPAASPRSQGVSWDPSLSESSFLSWSGICVWRWGRSYRRMSRRTSTWTQEQRNNTLKTC